MLWMLVVMFKTTAVLAASGLVALVLRKGSAATRHLVWSVGLGVAVLVPVFSWIAPTWSVPFGPVMTELPVTIAERLTDPIRTAQLVVPSSVEPRAAGAVAVAPRDEVESAAQLSPSPGATIPFANVDVDHQMQGPSAAQVVTYPSVLSMLASLWVVVALFLLTIVAMSVLRVARIGTRAAPIYDRRITRIAHELLRHLEISREVRFVETAASSMPMTWGAFRPTVLLPASAQQWETGRIRAVLLHELAHVKRWDYLTQLIARTACAMYWFNPIVWIAARELRIERERACDDAVLNAGSKASAYAGHLLDLARSLRSGSMMTIVSVAMARPSQLSGRLVAVLDENRQRRSVTHRTVLGAVLLSLLVAISVAGATAAAADVLAMPEPDATVEPGFDAPKSIAPEYQRGFVEVVVLDDDDPGVPVLQAAVQGCDWNAQSGKRSTSTSINDDRIRIRIEYGNCELHVDADGKITFSDDERDVLAIANDGYLEIEERVGRREWVVTIDSDNGRLTREWKVDGDVVAWGPEAEAWLANILPTLFRLTGLNAQERATRIYQNGGADALLQEIALIPSDHVARKYFSVLLAQGDLDSGTLRRVVRQAGEQIDSDWELAELLIYVAENQPLDENLQAIYVEASNNLSSDHEHRRVLSAILQRGNISQDLAESMLRSARTIDSDWEVAELLLEILERHPITAALTPAFFDVVSEIDSDHDRGRVIRAALEKGAPSPEILDGALAMAQDISSDWEMAELLLYIAELYPLDRSLPASYLEATVSLDSDYELSRVLRTLIERDQLSERALLDVLSLSARLDSDYEVTQVLTLLADRYQIAGTLQDAYFEALGDVDSDWSRGEILKNLLAKDPSTAMVKAIIESAMTISSDFELSELLIGIAKSHGVTDEIRDTFMRAADRIDSSYERGRVLDAALPRR